MKPVAKRIEDENEYEEEEEEEEEDDDDDDDIPAIFSTSSSCLPSEVTRLA